MLNEVVLGVRVIAGLAKGRRLKVPREPGVRPTQDRIRESLFTILGYPLDGRIVMDLFAGSGALGIEALSRGAEHATFVETNRSCIQVIQENLRLCGFHDRATVLSGDVPEDMPRIARAASRRFDLVFLDPPYTMKGKRRILKELHRFSLLRENARIVFEHSVKDPFPSVPEEFFVEMTRRYGDTTLTFIMYIREERSKNHG